MHDSLYHRWVQKWKSTFALQCALSLSEKTPALLCSNHGAPM